MSPDNQILHTVFMEKISKIITYRIRPFKRPGRLKKEKMGALIRNKIIGVILIENAEIPIKIGKVFMKKHGRKADKLSKSLLPC